MANNPLQSTKLTSTNSGMTRKEFARNIGVTSEAVRHWEKGTRKPSKDHADLFDRWEVIDSIWYPKS